MTTTTTLCPLLICTATSLQISMYTFNPHLSGREARRQPKTNSTACFTDLRPLSVIVLLPLSRVVYALIE
jgi:hypothetical protein